MIPNYEESRQSSGEDLRSALAFLFSLLAAVACLVREAEASGFYFDYRRYRDPLNGSSCEGLRGGA